MKDKIKPTYIWGAGHYGALAALDMEKKGETIVGFIDSNKELQGKRRLGYEVFAPSQIASIVPRGGYIIVIATLAVEQIIEELENNDYMEGRDFEIFESVKLHRKHTLKEQEIEKKNIDVFCNHFLKIEENKCYFEISGAKLPNISHDKIQSFQLINGVMQDTFFFSYFLNDNYNKSFVEVFDIYMHEGPYGYTDGNFDVTVKKGDVVIDAGAWIGDFSAYSANKGAECYAFEPTSTTFTLLEQTAELNKPRKIYPIKKGLSDKTEQAVLKIFGWSGGNSLVLQDNSAKTSEQISLTALDTFVAENNIEKIDFIKADIEGAERDMLRGATNVLKTFAPKLAICTYHLPDDPKVLEDIILEANPKYKVVHLRHKLFACVVKP